MAEINDHQIVIVGAGLTGSIIARELAEAGKRVLIIEKRENIGGNLYDYENDDGIIVQKYGPHTFHTNNDEVISYVSKFSNFREYHLRCEVNIEGTITPSPFNFKTIDQFYPKERGEILKSKLTDKYPEGKATVVALLESSDVDISRYANFLFEKDYSLYTSKQWGISPKDVDPSVLKRVPVEFSYKDWYFYDKFEGIPEGGFTKFISSILNHENITVVLNEDAFSHIEFNFDKVLFDGKEKIIVFTGELDKLLGYKYGKLPYRSLRFEFERYQGEYQSSAIVAYPSHDYEFTRITEYTKLPYQSNKNTIIAKEFPVPYNGENEPYYPILTENSKKQYELYKIEASRYKNLYIVGRLAEFKYYNMDQAVLSALMKAKEIKREI